MTKKREALATVRARLGWSRAGWIDEAQAVLGEALIVWCEARLAHGNGQRRIVRRLMLEFARRLDSGMVRLVVHPVKREFDRAASFDEAVTGMTAMAESLREYVEGRFSRGYGPLRKGLDDRDIEEFWQRAREAAHVLR